MSPHTSMPFTYAQAVRALCDYLAAEQHLVISANTDEQAQTPVFAQDASGALSFYFVWPAASPPSTAACDHWRALAASHQVTPCLAQISRDGDTVSIQRTPL